jgi:hypothetical protein
MTITKICVKLGGADVLAVVCEGGVGEDTCPVGGVDDEQLASSRINTIPESDLIFLLIENLSLCEMISPKA